MVLVAPGTPILLAADTYEVDSVHTFVFFKAKRAGFSYVVGRFNSISGTATWDETNAAERKLELTIQADSIDTGNERRDQHMRSPDFFNTKQFPQITFKSSEISETQVAGYEKAWNVTGELFLHGVVKPISFVLRQIGAGEDRRGNYNVGMQAEFVVDRSEFGMTNMLDQGGDKIECIVEVLARRQ